MIDREPGFITIHRQVLSSAIWQNIKDWRLASYLLLIANWKDRIFQARNGDVINISRGSIITSINSMSIGTGLTAQEIRTSLLHLKKANFLTSTSTNHFRSITIIKYNIFQDEEKRINKQPNKHLTSTQQALNNDIKDNKDNNITNTTKQNTDIAQSQEVSEPAILIFPICGNGSRHWGLTESKIKPLKEAFPAVDVVSESKKALAWVIANPDKKKTCSGMPKFLYNWIARVQNSQGGWNGPNQNGRKYSSERIVGDSKPVPGAYDSLYK